MYVSYDNGINIESNEFKFIIDSSRGVHGDGYVGVSHAHSDHVKKHSACVVSTPQTKQLLFFEPQKHNTLEYGKQMRLDGAGIDSTGIDISLHDANHVLGSAQFKIASEFSGKEVVYTGDFRLDKSLLFEGCEVVDCDKLIIESTYGVPEYKFQNPYDVMVEVKQWLNENQGKNIFFGAYSLGKAQEVIWILNQLNVTPVVHPRINHIARIYEQNNVKLGQFVSSDSEEGAEMMKSAFVGVVSPWLLQQHFFESLLMQNNCKSVSSLVTGWDFHRFGIRKIFHLSDHADFSQLMNYVEQCGARTVYTVHGFEKQFAKHIRKKTGLDARPLKSKQTNLSDFLRF